MWGPLSLDEPRVTPRVDLETLLELEDREAIKDRLRGEAIQIVLVDLFEVARELGERVGAPEARVGVPEARVGAPEAAALAGRGRTSEDKVKKKTFLVCPVRGCDSSRLALLVGELERAGWRVHWPPRDTPQDDPTGLGICEANLSAIRGGDCVHVAWDGKS